MAKDDSGNKTEKPTPKRLKDARKDGNVPRSRDLTATVNVLMWFVMIIFLSAAAWDKISQFTLRTIDLIGKPFEQVGGDLLFDSIFIFLLIIAPPLLITTFVGMFTDFLQVGPIFALKKVKPQAEKINPVEGVKRMFQPQNMVELVKMIAKSAAIIGIMLYVLYRMTDDLMKIPFAEPAVIGTVIWHGIFWVGIWTVFVFFFVASLDVAIQKYFYIKNLMMSHRDIRDEYKQTEGNPELKAKRNQLAREWAQQGTAAAVRKSSVVVTNPTHIAVALLYEDGKTDLPVVTAKGEDDDAMFIRRIAEEEGIPIVENVPLARGLYKDVEIESYITADYFQAVAEVLFWAESLKNTGRAPTPVDDADS